eukprot:14854603-Ditylum_brightwellii.AAC.1
MRTKKHGLSAKEVKDLNAYFKDKINETIKECSCDIHAMNNFEELLVSSINKSIQSIMDDTSVEDSDDEGCKADTKK